MSREARLRGRTDEELLALRFSELRLRIEGTVLEARVDRLYEDLERRGLRFRPHAWLSTEFFSPDGVPGIAIPFYLASPRLVRLERAQMLFAEAAGERKCMRILRHEAGHAFDTAYALHARRDWRATYGRRSQPYRLTFTVSPASPEYVRYLPHWYAQSHPAEDFAESFAVWLDPGSRWEARTTNVLARAKIERVDAMMREIADARPIVALREKTESIGRRRTTLARHYRRRRTTAHAEPALPFATSLPHVFEAGHPRTTRSSAAAWINANRRAIARRVAGPFRKDPYSVDQVFDDMVLCCREQGLRLKPKRHPPTLAQLAELVQVTLRTLQRGQTRLCR